MSQETNKTPSTSGFLTSKEVTERLNEIEDGERGGFSVPYSEREALDLLLNETKEIAKEIPKYSEKFLDNKSGNLNRNEEHVLRQFMRLNITPEQAMACTRAFLWNAMGADKCIGTVTGMLMTALVRVSSMQESCYNRYIQLIDKSNADGKTTEIDLLEMRTLQETVIKCGSELRQTTTQMTKLGILRELADLKHAEKARDAKKPAFAPIVKMIEADPKPEAKQETKEQPQ